MNPELQPSEQAIETWTINFLPGGKEIISGKLTVTNQRLLYEMLYNVASMNTILDSAYAAQKGENLLISIPKSDIKNVSVEKSFFAKKALVTVKDGTTFTFSRGMMNIDPVVEAIKA